VIVEDELAVFDFGGGRVTLHKEQDEVDGEEQAKRFDPGNNPFLGIPRAYSFQKNVLPLTAEYSTAYMGSRSTNMPIWSPVAHRAMPSIVIPK
jgi:hypothetical protein